MSCLKWTKTIVYKKTGDWYIEWQRVTMSGTTSENEWQGMTTSDNKWQRMTSSDNEWQTVTTNDNELQGMAASVTTNENEQEQVKQSDIKFKNETKGQSGSWIILFKFLCNM